MKFARDNISEVTHKSRPVRALWIEIFNVSAQAYIDVVEAREGLVD